MNIKVLYVEIIDHCHVKLCRHVYPRITVTQKHYKCIYESTVVNSKVDECTVGCLENVTKAFTTVKDLNTTLDTCRYSLYYLPTPLFYAFEGKHFLCCFVVPFDVLRCVA